MEPMEDMKRRRLRAWLLLAPAIIIVGLIVGSSFLQKAAPPGAQIVNQTVPARHPAGPCYQCHKDMPTGAQLQGRPIPQPHPTDRCAECHEGYSAAPKAPDKGSG
jgi:hypothetical protein